MSQGKATPKKVEILLHQAGNSFITETYDYMFLFDFLVNSIDYNIPHTFCSTSIHHILSTVLQYLTM